MRRTHRPLVTRTRRAGELRTTMLSYLDTCGVNIPLRAPDNRSTVDCWCRCPRAGEPSVYVAGNVVDQALSVNIEDTAPEVRNLTLGPDEASELQPVVVGRNHSQRLSIGCHRSALDARLGKTMRARPVARFIKRHGVALNHGE